MRNENKRAKLSALLIVCLLASSMPLLVFAEEHQETGKHSDTQLATASNADKDEDEDEADYYEIELLDDRKETTKASDAKLASASNADRNDEEDDLQANDEEAEEELEMDVELATASNAQEILTADIELNTATADLAAQLIGTWSVDDITFLEFDEDQSGSLILPDTDYTFHYTLKGDQLALDFSDSHVSDVTYTVSASGDDLQLVGGKAGTILLSSCDTTLP